MKNIKPFYEQCKRVFKITKKPTKEEYKAIMKVSALGILLIGFIGFIVHFINQMVGGI